MAAGPGAVVGAADDPKCCSLNNLKPAIHSEAKSRSKRFSACLNVFAGVLTSVAWCRRATASFVREFMLLR